MRVIFLANNDLSHLTGVVTVRTKSAAQYQCDNLAKSYREPVVCVLADDHLQVVASSKQ